MNIATQTKRPEQSRFEIMFDAINVKTVRQIKELIATLEAITKQSPEESHILWVARCVLADRLELVGA